MYQLYFLKFMKRAIVNFSNDFDYGEFKNYSEQNNISLSRALLELAQKSLTIWKDEQLADIALNRENSSSEYLNSKDFWNQFDV